MPASSVPCLEVSRDSPIHPGTMCSTCWTTFPWRSGFCRLARWYRSSKLSETVRLNHLAAEAVASAILADASLLVVASSELLAGACERFGIELTVAPV